MNNLITDNGLDFDKINPKIHDKYSPNLYKYLKKNSIHRVRDELWVDQDGLKWLGYLNDEKDFHGTMLNRVLCLGTKESSAFYFLAQFVRLTKIEDFWSDYIRIGRCAIDKEHHTYFINSQSRYIEQQNHRECTWCGHQQYKRRWEETIQREEWVSDLIKDSSNVIPEPRPSTNPGTRGW